MGDAFPNPTSLADRHDLSPQYTSHATKNSMGQASKITSIVLALFRYGSRGSFDHQKSETYALLRITVDIALLNQAG
jgi:hypothetical protein